MDAMLRDVRIKHSNIFDVYESTIFNFVGNSLQFLLRYFSYLRIFDKGWVQIRVQAILFFSLFRCSSCADSECGYLANPQPLQANCSSQHHTREDFQENFLLH